MVLLADLEEDLRSYAAVTSRLVHCTSTRNLDINEWSTIIDE